MHVLVTAGGTREPIDDVRVLTNRSTGRLGAQLADALLERGHEVTLLHGVGAALPAGVARCVEFDSSGDLAAHLERLVPPAGAVFHAAAVADYLPQRELGKLSSDSDSLTLHLTRAPKLIDRLRGLAPKALLVGFKLTSGASAEQRLAAAQALRERARLDLVLVNDASQLGLTEHEALLVGEGGVLAHFVGKPAIANGLAGVLDGSHPTGAEERVEHGGASP